MGFYILAGREAKTKQLIAQWIVVVKCARKERWCIMGGGHLDLIWRIREDFLEARIVLSFYYLGKIEETEGTDEVREQVSKEGEYRQ